MDLAAFVFQDTFLFSTTAFDNIAMNRAVDMDEVRRVAKAAMCHDFIEALPQGYRTQLGDGGHHVSGGEAQRIAIARAMLKDSPIVILDEATTFADADNEILIQQALARLLKGKTIIVIAHRLTTIQTADQILVLDKGEIRERGVHAQLLQDKGLYATLWDLQHQVSDWSLHADEGKVV